jgi:hypothetical protein
MRHFVARDKPQKAREVNESTRKGDLRQQRLPFAQRKVHAPFSRTRNN